jgi:formate hydrogenlyase subunit 3/multisubunit Na+/H+ antiporter MnhD subunit
MNFWDFPHWMGLLIMLPLLAAISTLLLSRYALVWLSLGTTLLIASMLTGLTLQIWEYGPQRYTIGGWGAPLGIDLYADGLSLLLLWLTLGVSGLVSLYALSYLSHAGERASRFWPVFFLLWAALNALLLAADVFNLYVTLELLTLAAVALVTLAQSGVVLQAALRYLLFAMLGSFFYLLGITLLYASYGILDMAHLGHVLIPAPATWLAIALITIGLLAKMAVFPLHGWLPPAHANALAPVSALLSALVVKASFYLLVRLWFQVFTAAITPLAGQLLGALGAIAIFYGSWQAVYQSRLKLLIAYSTIAQLGYLLLLFPLAAEAAWNGAMLHALAHGFAKAALFLAAGNLLYVLGHDRIAELRGLGHPLTLNLLSFGLAGVSIMGLPPSGGFLAKWLLLQAALDSGQWWWVPVILIGGLLAALYTFQVLGYAFVPAAAPATLQPLKVNTLPCSLQIVPLLLALISLLLGFAGIPLLALLRIGSPLSIVDPS